MRRKRLYTIFITTSFIIGITISSFDKQHPHPYQFVYPAYFGHHYTIPSENPETIEGVELGRMLFYENALSSDNTVSCSSCHQQEHAFTENNTFSEGVGNVKQRRNTMALINVLWTNHFFWDGRTQGLENQLDTPLTNTHEMNQSFVASIRKLEDKKIYAAMFKAAFGDTSITEDRIKNAIAQFERTLISCNSKFDLYLQGKYEPTKAEREGIDLFYGNPTMANFVRRPNCSHCHGGPKTYEELYMNNGLDSIYQDNGRAEITGADYDKGRFRVVTLRNIALTAPYMHDGRFNTLKEVIDHYSEHIVQSKELSPFLVNGGNGSGANSEKFSEEEKADLIAFLHMLTDSTFITAERFSDPFKKANLSTVNTPHI